MGVRAAGPVDVALVVRGEVEPPRVDEDRVQEHLLRGGGAAEEGDHLGVGPGVVPDVPGALRAQRAEERPAVAVEAGTEHRAAADAHRGVGVEYPDPGLHEVEHHQRAHQVLLGRRRLAQPPVPVVVTRHRVDGPDQRVSGCALVRAAGDALGEHGAVLQEAVGVRRGERVLDLCDGTQRVVLAGEVLQPVVVDPVGVKPVDRREVPVDVREVAVAAALQEHVHVPERP